MSCSSTWERSISILAGNHMSLYVSDSATFLLPHLSVLHLRFADRYIELKASVCVAREDVFGSDFIVYLVTGVVSGRQLSGFESTEENERSCSLDQTHYLHQLLNHSY